MKRTDRLLIDDAEKARLNRERIAKKENILGYVERESALEHYPANMPLPKEWLGEISTLTQGQLRLIDESEA